MTEPTLLTRRQRIDWTVVATVLILGVLGQAYALRDRPAAWPQLLPGLALLSTVASLLAAGSRPSLARALQLGSVALAGAAAFYIIEHWRG